MLINQQAVATHLAVAVKGLWDVKLSRHLCCKQYTVVCLWRGGGELCTSAVCGIWDTRYSSSNRFTSTVNANNFVLVERTIWKDSEAELVIQRTLFLINFCSWGLFLLAIHIIIAVYYGWAVILCERYSCVKKKQNKKTLKWICVWNEFVLTGYHHINFDSTSFNAMLC